MLARFFLQMFHENHVFNVNYYYFLLLNFMVLYNCSLSEIILTEIVEKQEDHLSPGVKRPAWAFKIVRSHYASLADLELTEVCLSLQVLELKTCPTSKKRKQNRPSYVSSKISHFKTEEISTDSSSGGWCGLARGK